ncbi:hypothetical protein D3C74_418780 [compost metagenome]
MTWYPAGVKAQKRAVPVDVMDEEDRKLLQDLRDRIQKVIEARGYDLRSDIDEILDRLTELHDLQAEVNRIDTVLRALEQYKPQFAKLIWLRYVDLMDGADVAQALMVSKRTYERWRPLAIAEYIRLMG